MKKERLVAASVFIKRLESDLRLHDLMPDQLDGIRSLVISDGKEPLGSLKTRLDEAGYPVSLLFVDGEQIDLLVITEAMTLQSGKGRVE